MEKGHHPIQRQKQLGTLTLLKNEQSSKLLNRKEYGSITHTIKTNTDDTIYLKIGDWPILIFSLLACLMGYIFRGKFVN